MSSGVQPKDSTVNHTMGDTVNNTRKQQQEGKHVSKSCAAEALPINFMVHQETQNVIVTD